jgi:hypothetical protein
MKRFHIVFSFIALMSLKSISTYAQEEQLLIHFDKGMDADKALGNKKATVTGATLTAEQKGFKGEALQIHDGNTVVYEGANNLEHREGTIAFWFKPSWSSGDKRAHTLFSAKLASGAIFRLSTGCEEDPKLKAPFYFLLQNWKGANAPVNFSFTADEWVHIIASWQIGEKPFLYVFANGKRILGNDQAKYFPENSEAVESIFLGSDPDGLRSADGLIDEFVVLNKSLTDHEANLFFRAQGGTGKGE